MCFAHVESLTLLGGFWNWYCVKPFIRKPNYSHIHVRLAIGGLTSKPQGVINVGWH
jgi:hypothetical protein